MMNSVFNQQIGGYQYGVQQAPKRKWTNALTKEQEQFLHQTAPEFSLDVPQADLFRARCTHRDAEHGRFTVVPNNDGSYTCTKCGKTFNIVNQPAEKIEEYVNGIVDILETSKMMYVDMPVETITGYYQMIPFLEKLPKLYEIATSNPEQLVPNGTVQPTGMFGNPFAMLNNAVGNPAFGMPMYGGYSQQPMMGYQQPVAQPYQNGFTGTPGVDPTNPFQQQMPQFGQQMAPPFMQPVQMSQQAVQTAPAGQEVAPQANSQDQQQVQVQKKFEI